MKIAFNPSTVAALTSPPDNKDITFDLRGRNIFARGVKFYGTDTWRPVVDNLTSNSATSSLSANQGRVLAGLINGKSDSDHNHDGRYLKLTGGTLTGNLVGTSAMFSGRFYGNGDDEGIIIKPSSNGYAGLILGTHDGERSIFYFVKNKPFWRYSHGSDNLDIIHPKKSGTIALISDIPNKNSWNYDDRYLKLTGGTMLLGEGLKFHANDNYFGTNADARIISLLDNNDKICDGGLIIDERATLDGKEYVTELLRIRDSEFKWRGADILHSGNYSSILDSRYYTESEVNSLLSKKLDRVNLSVGSWNPRGYNLAADYFYNGGDLSISESKGQIHVSIDGYFWQNEGQYRVLDTSDVAGLKGDLTVHQYLSATDTAWRPLIWGGSSHANTSDSTGAVYKSHDVLSWQTSSQTLYATHLRTTNLDTQTAIFHPDNDSTLKIYSGRTQDAVSDGHIGLQTSIDNTDGQTHVYPTQYGSRCVLALQPRGGSVYIGNMPNGGNGRKLNVNGDIGLFNTGSIRDLAIGGGIYWNPNVESATDGSGAASITLVKSGVAGGTTLVLSQMNDANDTIQFKTNTAAKLYHNSYPILTTQNTYVSNHKGYINGTEITQVNNADTVDGWHKDNIQWTGYITSGDTLASYWFKMYDITVTRYPYNDITITFLVSEGYSSHFSIFYLRIRQNGAIDSGNYGLSISLYELVGNLRDKVVAYYNNSTGNVQLWGNTGSRWGTMNYTILKKTTRTDTDSSSLGTLTAQSFSSVQTPPSTGYSKVTMSRVGSVSYSDSTGSVHWNNITNKPSTFNPAAHTHTVFKNNLMIKGTNGVSDSASIHLGIGDSDTGFKWISDGVCQIYANNVAIGQWTSGGMNWFKNPTVNGNKVWNAGNDGSGSGLDADTVDGEHASNFSYTHQSSFNFNTIKNGRIVTFDQSNTDYGWINGFASTHNNYLTSVIFNSHRTSYWYVGYMQGNYSTGKTNGLQEVHRLAFVDQIPTKLSQLTNDSGFITSSASISGNAGSATKLQTARRIWGQSFNGTADVNGTIYINNGDSENGAIILNNNVNTHARISAIGDQVVFNTGSALRFGGTEWEYSDWAGIKYDTVANAIYLGIADGTVFNYYTNKRSNGTLKFPGISNINLDDNAQIRREGSSQSWVNGRNGALLRETSVAGYHALWSLKTTNGSWDFGEYNAGSDWNNIPVLSYITDSNYNSGNNAPTYQIKFPLASGTVALTSNILNPTNYYWANVKISTSSSTTTSPTVHTLTATRICAGHDPGIDNSISCSNWFRSSGNTGWYNTTYEGGWYMSDTSWIRTHNSVGIYTSKIYANSSIRMSSIRLEKTNEINSSDNLLINYGSSTNVSLCNGGGNVGIGTMSPTQRLDVNGNIITKGFGIQPCYLSELNLLPTISPGDGYKYKCLEIGRTTEISCIIADKAGLMDERGILIKFNKGYDGQIILLKDLQNYGSGNGYFWVMPSGCNIIRADGSSILVGQNQISNTYDDGHSRFLVYSSLHNVWIEFLCANIN